MWPAMVMTRGPGALAGAPGGAPDPVALYAARVVGLGRAIVGFAEKNPRMAFMAGIEPIVVELRLALGPGARGSASSYGAGFLGRLASAPSMDAVRHMADLERETHRRLSEFEAEATASSGPSLGQVVERGLSVLSSVVCIAMAVA